MPLRRVSGPMFPSENHTQSAHKNPHKLKAISMQRLRERFPSTSNTVAAWKDTPKSQTILVSPVKL